jgi:hypothetical protein
VLTVGDRHSETVLTDFRVAFTAPASVLQALALMGLQDGHGFLDLKCKQWNMHVEGVDAMRFHRAHFKQVQFHNLLNIFFNSALMLGETVFYKASFSYISFAG